MTIHPLFAGHVLHVFQRIGFHHSEVIHMSERVFLVLYQGYELRFEFHCSEIFFAQVQGNYTILK